MSLNYSNLCLQSHPRGDGEYEVERMWERMKATNQEHIGGVRNIATRSKQLLKIVKL